MPRSESPLDLEQSSQQASEQLLTPIRAHYLKKYLIQLQFEQELDAITTASPYNISTLAYLGPPFNPPPKDAPPIDLPFLRYVFRQFVLTFPFMASAPKDFYSDKLQPFAAAMLSRNLSPTSVFDDNSEASEQATRLKFLARIERNFSLFLGAATKLVEREEVVRLSQADLDRLETLSKKREARNLKRKDIFDVNIISVRTVVDKGRVRSRAHEEFIIRTRRSNNPDWFVSRRYGDFRTLANELRKAHPQEDIRMPPAKDRTMVNVSSPMNPSASFARQQSNQPWDGESLDVPSSPVSHNSPSRLAREKNRLTLRAYLHSLLSSPTIASSPVLRSFLLSGPTTLNAEELEDARWREEADKTREEGRKKFAREIAHRVEGLRGAVRDMKGDLMDKDGVTHIFDIIKITPNIRDLPSNFQAVIEWARISLASTIFQQLVASDNASETFASLKRFHGLMPYFMLKAALKISNPMGMIRGVLDLFLAQPFGGRSLLQRMFTGSLTEEVKALEEEIEAVKAKVEDPIICEKIKYFVYAPKEIQDMYKADAVAEKLNLVAVVLRSGDEPVLNRAQIHRVAKANRAHIIYLRHRATLDDSDDDDGPQDEDAWLFEDLKILGHLYSRLRDREQLISLIFEGFTAELLKDIITIFYAPLAQVYRAASIADSISDLQNFITDLIKTVEQTEELAQEDPNRTVQIFIDLVQRHEQSFYSFVYRVHSKGEGLFNNLMHWIELFLTIIREGFDHPISLEYLLPHKGKERADILNEVDQLALYHYKLKLLYEDKIRRRFGRSQGQSDADAEDQATKALVDGVVGEISFNDVVQGDAIDVAAEDSDSEEEDDSDYETASDDSDDSSDEDSEDDSETASEGESNARQFRRTTPTPSVGRGAAASRSRPPENRRPMGNQQHPPLPVLKTSKSLINLSGKKPSTSTLPYRRSEDLPPVPPLPRSTVSATNPLYSSTSAPLQGSTSKPLPPSPGSDPGTTTATKSKRRKVKATAIKRPELEHIPQLLPIFKEMVSHHISAQMLD
ncbi:hypothetical protein K435DRAFT_642163 [Dendrothele bispora CBS 962.96]|uniref:PX domain-containing protein n=1 Tax=Dendrothele bispora (strain CBS 962.96) TaxID=1314807 RepID=A0A4S8MYQ3_DENBC|nr:hypothetical protein K435DRAFT_642163 [Dendrothele bispora CBS 962.96]